MEKSAFFFRISTSSIKYSFDLSEPVLSVPYKTQDHMQNALKSKVAVKK